MSSKILDISIKTLIISVLSKGRYVITSLPNYKDFRILQWFQNIIKIITVHDHRNRFKLSKFWQVKFWLNERFLKKINSVVKCEESFRFWGPMYPLKGINLSQTCIPIIPLPLITCYTEILDELANCSNYSKVLETPYVKKKKGGGQKKFACLGL